MGRDAVRSVRCRTTVVPKGERTGSAGIRLRLLGGFSLTIDGELITLPECCQRLISLVALHERPQPRRLVAGTLWPEKTEARASANLRSALWRAQVPGASLIVADGPMLRLSSGIDLDTMTFEDVGWSIVAEPSLAVAADRRLFFEELLPGCYDDWVIVERERLALLGLHFLEAMAEGLAAAGRCAEALDTAFRLVKVDPLRERSQLLLIRILVNEGSRARAAAQAVRYTRVITTTFGRAHTATFEDAARLLIESPPGSTEIGEWDGSASRTPIGSMRR